MIESDRFVASTLNEPVEESIERALRPKELQEYVGQEKVRSQLEIFISAAKNRNEALDHVLLFGPPGLGKTTLAHIIAKEMGVNLRQTSGPVLEKAGDLAALLTNLEPNDVLFIDEIHTIVGAGGASGSLDASNIVKPALARGELQCIGASTLVLFAFELRSVAWISFLSLIAIVSFFLFILLIANCAVSVLLTEAGSIFVSMAVSFFCGF